MNGTLIDIAASKTTEHCPTCRYSLDTCECRFRMDDHDDFAIPECESCGNVSSFLDADGFCPTCAPDLPLDFYPPFCPICNWNIYTCSCKQRGLTDDTNKGASL